MTDRGKEQPFAARRKIPAVEWKAKKKKKKRRRRRRKKKRRRSGKKSKGRKE